MTCPCLFFFYCLKTIFDPFFFLFFEWWWSVSKSWAYPIFGFSRTNTFVMTLKLMFWYWCWCSQQHRHLNKNQHKPDQTGTRYGWFSSVPVWELVNEIMTNFIRSSLFWFGSGMCLLVIGNIRPVIFAYIILVTSV